MILVGVNYTERKVILFDIISMPTLTHTYYVATLRNTFPLPIRYYLMNQGDKYFFYYARCFFSLLKGHIYIHTFLQVYLFIAVLTFIFYTL